MNTPNHLTIRDSTSEGSPGSLSQLIDQSNHAIERSRAEIARSQALSQAEADLARAIDQISKEETESSRDREG